MTPLEQYPSARKVVYLLFWVAGLIIGSIAVYIAVATEQPTPGWLKGAQAVLAFLAVPIGYTAAANVVDKGAIGAIQPADAPDGQLVAGPAADVPVDTPVDVVPTDDAYTPRHAADEPNVPAQDSPDVALIKARAQHPVDPAASPDDEPPVDGAELKAFLLKTAQGD